MKTHFLKVTLSALVFVMVGLAGCQQNQQQVMPSQQNSKKYLQATLLQGLVSNQQDALSTGRVEASNDNGQVLATADVQKNGRYQLEIPANTALPVILTYIPVENEQQKWLTVAIDPSIKHYDLNALTTAIANKAKALGGYTRTNLVVAAESTIAAPAANKTSTGFRGDPTTQYGGWH